MTSISAKILEAFRNLRADAVPRAPRPNDNTNTNDVTGETHTEDSNNGQETIEEPEEIFVFPENDTKKDKPKKKQNFSKTKDNKSGGSKINNLNTKAGGTVFNIIDSPEFHLGHDFVYNLGPTTQCNHPKKSETFDRDEEYIEQTNEITLLMEAKVSPEHEYIDYVAKNLGKNWHSFFRKLGYSKGRIETFEIDESRNGVSEARYKLLLDWIRNDDDGTLGRLATILWEKGERQIVKELSIIYSVKGCK